MKQNRPNIIFIQNDHQAYYRWGWDGGIRPKRPYFERLASEGAIFQNAYCATPLCGPTRRSILTGLYPHAHKQFHNYTDPPYDTEVYLDTLSEAGYQNFYFGKWHAGPGAADEHHCSGFSHTSYGNPYITPEYDAYCKRRGLPRAVHHVSRIFDVPEYGEQGYFLNMAEGQDYQSESNWCGEHAIGLTTTPKETHESFFLANLACEQLEELARNPDDKPFSLRVDFWGPHQPHFPTQEFLDQYPDFDLPMYGSFNSTLDNKPKFYHTERSSPFGQDNGLLMPSPLKWDEWKEIIRHCFAHITMVDAAGGLILDKLKQLGLDKNTLIIWTTDHGDGLASHGGHFDKGSYCSEEVMRIPLAMRWPDVIQSGQIRDEYVSTVDYPVTILDAAGTAFSKNAVHGASLLPIVKGESINWRDDIFSEHYGHGYGYELISRMVVHDGYKYVATYDHISELYHLPSDPYELNNRINDPTYAEVLKEMQSHLRENQQRTNDPEIGIE